MPSAWRNPMHFRSSPVTRPQLGRKGGCADEHVELYGYDLWELIEIPETYGCGGRRRLRPILSKSRMCLYLDERERYEFLQRSSPSQ
jgi:hypothetical protein